MMRLFFLLIAFSYSSYTYCQPVPVVKETIQENRDKTNQRILNFTIIRNLALPLHDSTEDRWQDAFYSIQLLQYNNAWIDKRVASAVKSINDRSIYFQQSLLELLHSGYKGKFIEEIYGLFNTTNDTKIFVTAGEYLLNSTDSSALKEKIFSLAEMKLSLHKNNPLLKQFLSNTNTSKPPALESLFQKDFLPGNILMISLQRENRDYPGLVIIRNAAGEFIKDETGNIFSVPQLARSINGLPGYITNGNTPEGIFRMDGFDVSKSNMIGPTTNIQLTMPGEYKANHFYKDSSLKDSLHNISWYKKLLPDNLKDYLPLYQSFYAGQAGRTEIIAHGTTVDPSYYNSRPYFPLTPTMGCLCTKEIWDNKSGTRMESDQQMLVNALIKAGGAKGYAIVVNIDNKEGAVSMADLLPLLKKRIK